MKKHLLYLLIVITALVQTDQLNAQFRRYPKLRKYDGDRTGRVMGRDVPVVDRYGRPRCCESRNEFNFPLTFNSFSILNQLDSQIAAARRARRKVDEWLKKQENTFLKEINRQMGRNYTSFSTAQREYFKFYEGGKYGNLGPIARSRELSAKNGVWSKNWMNTANNNLIDNVVLDEWIKCGYCDDLYGNAMEVNNLEAYDVDYGPGPKFYAKVFKDDAYLAFGEAYYTSGLNKSRSVGLAKMVNEGNILKKISDLRVADYRRLGWQEKVFQMSAYLISNNTNCRTPQFTCLPSSLSEYKPPLIWNDSILLNWSKEYSPAIPRIQFIYSDEYMQQQINLLTTGSYGVWSRQAIINMVKKERKDVFEVTRNLENTICGGIRWKRIASANYTTLTGLRLFGNRTVAGIPIPWSGRYFQLRDICVEIPNFRIVNGQRKTITQAQTTANLKIAWIAAVRGLRFAINISRMEPTEETIKTLFLENLQLMLESQRPGSKVRYGYCSGSPISNVRFCKN